MTPKSSRDQPGRGRRRLIRRQVGDVTCEIDPAGFMVYLAVMALGVYAVVTFGPVSSARHWWAGFAVPAREVVAGLALLVLSTATHELGHAVGYWLTGTRVKKVMVGSRNGLYGETPSTPARAVVVLVLGPLFGLVYGAGLLTFSWSMLPAAAAGGIAVFLAAVNLLPVPATSDGGQIFRILRRSTTGRTERLPARRHERRGA